MAICHVMLYAHTHLQYGSKIVPQGFVLQQRFVTLTHRFVHFLR